MSDVKWRRTELTQDLIRCDLCGQPADTVHFLTDGKYPGAGGDDDRVEVVFACRDHDAGGYHAELNRWFNPKERFPEHIEEKSWGGTALAELNSRFNGILHDAAERDRSADGTAPPT